MYIQYCSSVPAVYLLRALVLTIPKQPTDPGELVGCLMADSWCFQLGTKTQEMVAAEVYFETISND